MRVIQVFYENKNKNAVWWFRHIEYQSTQALTSNTKKVSSSDAYASCPMSHMSKDLKAGSKAWGSAGPVGGRFWDSFSWSQRDFAMYLWGARPWHPWAWRASVTGGLWERKSSRNCELSLYLSLIKFLAFHGISWVKHYSGTFSYLKLTSSAGKTALKTNGMMGFKMQCSFLQISTDHTKSKSSWKLKGKDGIKPVCSRIAAPVF